MQLPDIFFEKPDRLQIAIDDALAQLPGLIADSDEYVAKVDQITRLYKLKEQTAPKRVDPNTWVMAAAHLVGMTMIIRYEKFDVITTKALGFLPKLR